MRSFDSRHYILVGFSTISIDGVPTRCWVLETRVNPNISNFSSATIMVDEAKFVDAGKVYFLKKDGSVEDSSRALAVLPCFE